MLPIGPDNHFTRFRYIEKTCFGPLPGWHPAKIGVIITEDRLRLLKITPETFLIYITQANYEI
jgi:hypothetical protein